MKKKADIISFVSIAKKTIKEELGIEVTDALCEDMLKAVFNQSGMVNDLKNSDSMNVDYIGTFIRKHK